MKKIITAILCATLLLASLAISTWAGAWNAAGGCQIENTIMKTDPSRVEKDGVIGVGEYTEIELNRDPDTTDLMISYLNTAQYLDAKAFLNNVHFYMSWDEVHGINIAATAELIEETPKNEDVWPPERLSTDDNGFTYPGDDFMWQFGLMFKTFITDEMSNRNTLYYRAFNKNTATGELQYGYYNQNGYTGNYQMTPHEDYIVTINGNFVTYEFSCPIADFLPESDLVNGLPVEGAMFRYALTVSGGSEGTYMDSAKTYAVSVGDYGYMTSWVQWRDGARHAHGIFTSEMIKVDSPVITGDNTTASDTEPRDTSNGTPVPDDNVTADAPVQPSTTRVVDVVVTKEVVVTDEDGNTVTDENGNRVTEVESEVVASVVTDAPTESAGGGTSAVPTGSPMIIAAVVAAISACGVVVAKKRK